MSNGVAHTKFCSAAISPSNWRNKDICLRSLLAQEEDVFLERDPSGQPRKLGDGAFGQVMPVLHFSPMRG